MAEGDESAAPERRVFRRTDLSQLVEIIPLPDGDEPMHGELVNVGCGGLLARVDGSLEEGTRCRVRIVPAEDDVDAYSTSGVVTRVRRTHGGGRVAIEFDERIDTVRAPAGPGFGTQPFRLLPIRVLVADDEQTIRDILERFLRGRGCVVEVATDGLETLASLRREQADLLLLDIRMPGLDGLEVLRVIGEEELPVGPIWAISGYASDEEARKALRLGAADFINKPLDLNYLDWSLKLHRLGGVVT